MQTDKKSIQTKGKILNPLLITNTVKTSRTYGWKLKIISHRQPLFAILSYH